MSKKIVVICLSVLIVFLSFGPGFGAPKYPAKKIRFVVVSSPGGGADLTARDFARYVNPYLENMVYVENIVGGGGGTDLREGTKLCRSLSAFIYFDMRRLLDREGLL